MIEVKHEPNKDTHIHAYRPVGLYRSAIQYDGYNAFVYAYSVVQCIQDGTQKVFTDAVNISSQESVLKRKKISFGELQAILRNVRDNSFTRLATDKERKKAAEIQEAIDSIERSSPKWKN